MTLGRLMELYQAEQQGKQIMCKKLQYGYYSNHKEINEVTISDCDLGTFIFNDTDNDYYIYFIKDEEDEYGDKINKE